MSSQDALRRAKQFITEQDGVIAPLSISEEELNPNLQDDLSLQVVPLESKSSCYTVDFRFPDDSKCSEFSYFEDGRQRTVQIGFIPTVIGTTHVLLPVHFFAVAAVIMKRENCELKVWDKAQLERGIFIERSLVPDQAVLEKFEELGLNVVGISAQGGDYYDLKRQALQESKNRRLAIEDRLISKWRQSEDADNNFLVIDGTLLQFRNEHNVERCIGVSKSFVSRYFSQSDHNRILQMSEFQRSWTFRFHSPDDESDDPRLGQRERLSWYLRLRDRKNADPEFGLIRVEISHRHAANAAQYANQFSRSLLSDRLPTSYPAPRWDKHLYPICACESYLSSIMPSISTISASMKG